MPETDAPDSEGGRLGFGDVVVDNLARQLAAKSVDLAVAETKLLVQKQEFEKKIDEMSRTISELQEQMAPSAAEADAPKESAKVKHNGRTTEKVKTDG